MTANTPSLREFVVLVVDDDPDSLALATTIVQSFGCSVLSAGSCDAALEIIDSGAHVDLVFSDVVMPDTSGIGLARLVKERRPGLPVVRATGHPEAIDTVTDSGPIPRINPY
jgi:CheY-like chemotaxis protein